MQISQVGNTYADRRKWADGYITSMNMMAAELLMANGLIQPTFTPPTVHEDSRQDGVLKIEAVSGERS